MEYYNKILIIILNQDLNSSFETFNKLWKSNKKLINILNHNLKVVWKKSEKQYYFTKICNVNEK